MRSAFAPRQTGNRDTHRRHRSTLACTAALALVACGGGGRPHADAAVGDALADAADDRTIGTADGGDAAGNAPIARLPIRGAPLPPGVPRPRRILDGNVMLTGDGPSTCSHQQPASDDGHRWCAFARPGDAGATELWVFDLTALAAGAPLACDGTSAGCRRLSAALWTGSPLGGPSHPYGHAFDGDTLIFYADGSAGGATGLHRGPVYAWRPGWAAARLITSTTGLLCRGHARTPLAHCLDDLIGDPLRPDSFELRAGTVAGADGAPLPSLGRVHPLTPDGESAWQVGFTPDGEALGLSSPATDPTVPVLRVHPISGGAPGAPTPIARDVRGWKFAHDGRRMYLVRQPPGSPPELSVIALAPGAAPEVLATGVQSFELIGDSSAGLDMGVAALVLETGRRVLRLVGDPRAPGAVTGVFTHRGTPEAVRVSLDGTQTAWITDDFVGRLVRHADQSICHINTSDEVEVFRLGFMGNARLLLWTESAPDDVNRRDAFFAPPGNCRQSARFGHGVQFLHPVGERGVVLGDELEEAAERVTLKVVPAGLRDGQFVLDEALRVDEKVGQYVTVASEQPLLVLYRKDGQGPAVDGVYLFGPAPF